MAKLQTNDCSPVAAHSLRVSELLHTNRGDWESVCECMIADSARHPEIPLLLQQLPTIQLNEIVKRQARELVRIDAGALANIIAARLADETERILQVVRGDSPIEYALLAALHGRAEGGKKEPEATDKVEEEDDPEPKSGDGLKSELSTQNLERFLELMCEIEPERVSVLPS
jgi:hypothetical protein